MSHRPFSKPVALSPVAQLRHGIVNPLGNLIGYAELIQDEAVESGLTEAAEIAGKLKVCAFDLADRVRILLPSSSPPGARPEPPPSRFLDSGGELATWIVQLRRQGELAIREPRLLEDVSRLEHAHVEVMELLSRWMEMSREG